MRRGVAAAGASIRKGQGGNAMRVHGRRWDPTGAKGYGSVSIRLLDRFVATFRFVHI